MKRIRLIGIVATLLAVLYVSSVSAQSDWDLVNFDMLNLPREPGSHPVTYTMYYSPDPLKIKSLSDMELPLIFGGELVRTRSIDIGDKKKAVLQALDDLGWNFTNLRNVIERAAQAKPNEITNEEFWDDILTMAGVNGFVADALGLITGVKDRQRYYDIETFQNRLRNEAGKYLMGKAIDQAGKMIDFVDRTNVFFKARERDKQKWINRVAEYNLISLGRFYRIANNRLWQIAQKKEHAWVLRVSGSANAPFLYEDVMCVQQWKIKMELEKNPHGENEKLTDEQFTGTFNGEYIGWLEADVLYSMENWDANYLVDKQLRLFIETEIVGYLPNVSDVRFNQSLMKVRADNYGYEFKHNMKPTVAYNTYRLPVKVVVKPPKELAKSIYTYMHVFTGDEEWMPGDKPQPHIESKFQMMHNVLFFGSWGDEISVKEGWYLNHYATKDSIIVEGNRRSDFTFGNLGTLPLRGKDRYSEAIGEDGFGGKPNGTIRVHLDQSLNDVDKWGRIGY